MPCFLCLAGINLIGLSLMASEAVDSVPQDVCGAGWSPGELE